MKRVGAVLAGLVCLASADVRADASSPLIDGDYQVGTFGVLHLSSSAVPAPNKVERFAVRGTYVRGDKCGFAPSELLLEGLTEGTVLIASFTTCVDGSGCQSPSKLSLMAVMREGLLSGYITLPKGCEAKGLEQRVTMELLPEALQPAAKAFMKAQPPAFERAIPLLRRLGSLQEGREDVEVFQLLGSALNGTKDFQAGKEVFERTLRMPSFPSASPEQRALVLYNLGCAESALSVNEPGLAAQAVEHIRQSLSLKGTTIKKEDAAADGDLAPLRSNPDFQKMLGLRKGPR